MKNRIAGWVCAGFIVGGFWALYFSLASEDSSVGLAVYALARITQPVALVIQRFRVSFYLVILADVATYALVGLIVETFRRQLKRKIIQT
jgi:hypothetical protein